MKKVNEVLDTIDEFLSDENISRYEREYLWDILTALRGPDAKDSYTVKDRTTIPIRRAAFPKVAKHAEGGNYFVPADFGNAEHMFNLDWGEETDAHFEYHAQNAASALDFINRPVSREKRNPWVEEVVNTLP